MRTSLLHTALAALLLAGCAQNEITDVSPDAAPPVGFKVFTDAQTRGLITNGNATSANVAMGIQTTGFGVFAYYTGQSAWNNTGSFTPNFMYNQMVEYKSGWTYTPVKYWPNTEGDKISFFAYAPYSTGSTNGIAFTTTTKNSTGAPKLNFTLQTTPQNMIDLVATNAGQSGNEKTIDVTKKTDAVAFKLKHVLTRASFKAKLDASLTGTDGKTHVFVTGMRILGKDLRNDPNGNTGNNVTANGVSKFYSGATYQWSDGTWNYTSPAATQQGAAYELGNTSFMPLVSKTGVINSSYTTSGIELPQGASEISLLNANQYAFLIPPVDITGITAATDVKMQLDYDIVTVDANLSKGYSVTSTTATVSLPNTTLQRGKAYLYTFTVGLEKVQVSATVEDWALPVQDAYIPSTTATTSTLTTAIGAMNTAKGNNKNCNYFVINCASGSYGTTLNLTTPLTSATSFVSGDKIDLKFASSPSISTGVTVPTEWKASPTTLTSTGSIILEKK